MYQHIVCESQNDPSEIGKKAIQVAESTNPTPKGRIFVGYCLIVASPAIGWMLEDRGFSGINNRIIVLAVLVAGVLLTLVGKMTLDASKQQ